MRQGFAITLAVVGVAAAVAVIALNESYSSTNLHAMEITQDNIDFAQYLAKHGKSYGTKEEYQFRFEQYKKNVALINIHNQENGNTFFLAPNKFTDYKPEEYRRLLGYKKVATNDIPEYSTFNESDIPASIDWRTKGAVNAVKDQGQCGSCWAFSTVGALEGRYKIKTGKLLSLSEQELVDCSKNGNQGCNGGDMGLAFDYLKSTQLELETDYPYKAVDQKCQFNKAKGKVGDQGHTNVQPNSVAALKAAIAQGPVSVAIEADTSVFQSYGGGILNSRSCGTNLDHGVVAVGYGSQGKQDYYIVRNSWGASWGENGYVRIAATNGAGICGIQMEPVVPKL
ncbi:cathepsin l [Stylonychia lemnae]|uniref:Cathepsin l n=1 Tax=Stylonychia lemnae TaxID=5949 RepID=A0A078B8E5_STYLE|nr:cathepsin l [Stylonychia lemnae]|eukprot:CDW90466.1 cathepsin l [Stylonychia lemnae]